jgi:hypothetical protein
VNWSPNLQTAVSDLEVEYSEELGKLYYFKYMLADGSGNFIPVATTRPETILGDTAVCVHPEDERYKAFVGKKVKVPMTDREIPGKQNMKHRKQRQIGGIVCPVSSVALYELLTFPFLVCDALQCCYLAHHRGNNFMRTIRTSAVIYYKEATIFVCLSVYA